MNDLNALARFLARRDVPKLTVEALGGPVDAIVLVGGSVLATADVVSKAYLAGASNRILITGGIGHSTKDLGENVRAEPDLFGVETEGRAEADVLADMLQVRYGIPLTDILIENGSTNCGANARETKRVLAEHEIHAGRLIIVQDPTMQLRTHLSFERAWRGERAPEFISFAPFIPVAGEKSVEPPAWTFDRFVSLVLGEFERLPDTSEGYGPKGRDFIEHIDIADELMLAYSRVSGVWKGDRR